MYKHLLVAVDGSKLSQKAVAHAIALAKPLKAKITVFYAAPEPPLPVYSEGVVYQPMPAKAYAAAMAKEAERILAPVVARAQKAGVATEMRHAIAGAPWEAIIEGAKKSKCDAIVMASHGRRGVAALLLGSETQKVLTHGKLPVIVVR
jgi:nucleotide-binding universal stress UspA family protein